MKVLLFCILLWVYVGAQGQTDSLKRRSAAVFGMAGGGVCMAVGGGLTAACVAAYPKSDPNLTVQQHQLRSMLLTIGITLDVVGPLCLTFGIVEFVRVKRRKSELRVDIGADRVGLVYVF